MLLYIICKKCNSKIYRKYTKKMCPMCGTILNTLNEDYEEIKNKCTNI